MGAGGWLGLGSALRTGRELAGGLSEDIEERRKRKKEEEEAELRRQGLGEAEGMIAEGDLLRGGARLTALGDTGIGGSMAMQAQQAAERQEAKKEEGAPQREFQKELDNIRDSDWLTPEQKNKSAKELLERYMEKTSPETVWKEEQKTARTREQMEHQKYMMEAKARMREIEKGQDSGRRNAAKLDLRAEIAEEGFKRVRRGAHLVWQYLQASKGEGGPVFSGSGWTARPREFLADLTETERLESTRVFTGQKTEMSMALINILTGGSIRMPPTLLDQVKKTLPTAATPLESAARMIEQSVINAFGNSAALRSAGFDPDVIDSVVEDSKEAKVMDKRMAAVIPRHNSLLGQLTEEDQRKVKDTLISIFGVVPSEQPRGSKWVGKWTDPATRPGTQPEPKGGSSSQRIGRFTVEVD
jgi:hypothetical protein